MTKKLPEWMKDFEITRERGDDLRPDQHPDKKIADFESAYILFSLPEKPKTDKGK